jgi:hypothetical protein
VALLVLLVSCRHPPVHVGTERVTLAPPVKTTSGMMDVAIEIAGGNVGGLIHIERLREHPTTWPVLRLGGLNKLFEDMGLDPIFDVDRAFVTASGVISCRPVLVVRHHLPRARVAQAFEQLLANSREPGARIDNLGFPAIRVRTRKLPQLVIAPRDDHFVMLPLGQSPLAADFVGGAPLPPPRDQEVWFGWSNEAGWPPFPPALDGFTLTNGTLKAYVGEKHIIKLRGWARTQTEATANAAILQKAADSVLRLPVIGSMIMDPIDFHAVGDEVAADVVLGPPEHQWILAHMTDGCW